MAACEYTATDDIQAWLNTLTVLDNSLFRYIFTNIADYARSCISWLSENNHLSGKSTILVGNKTDLARSRVVGTPEGCNLAVRFGVKFAETSPGMGHHIDELLVGIVMQLR